MFTLMRSPARRLESYAAPAGAGAVARLRALAAPLRGARVLHVSFSPFLTAMAELIGAVVPLLRDLGLEADWQVASCPEPYMHAAHELYRGFSGRRVRWGPALRESWRRYGEELAAAVPSGYDVVVVHEPQPVALAARVAERGSAGSTRWVWHTQLDLRRTQPEVWNEVRGDLDAYAAILLSSRAFAAPDLPAARVVEMPPGLDPLGTRNAPLTSSEGRQTLARHGIDTDRPLALQVGPLDAAHDPLGALRAFREAKRFCPEAQLVLIEPLGSAGGDAWARFEQMLRRVGGDPDIHVLAGVAEVGHLALNAAQRAARVVLQRAVPAGHPMTVLEAQWKARPVIVGPGSMRDLIVPGETGVAADDDSQFAAALAALLRDSALADRMGAAGHTLVRERFLITRWIADELRLLAQLLGASSG